MGAGDDSIEQCSSWEHRRHFRHPIGQVHTNHLLLVSLTAPQLSAMERRSIKLPVYVNGVPCCGPQADVLDLEPVVSCSRKDVPPVTIVSEMNEASLCTGGRCSATNEGLVQRDTAPDLDVRPICGKTRRSSLIIGHVGSPWFAYLGLGEGVERSSHACSALPQPPPCSPLSAG